MLKLTKQELENISEPLRYIGNEYGSIKKAEYDIKIRVALCYPNLYDIGMKNYTFLSLYNTLNKINGVYCERCFMPYIDFENLLKDKNIELFSLETNTPISKFNFVIFVLPSEIEYINVITMLRLSNLNKNNNKSVLIGVFDNNDSNHYPLADIFNIFVYNDCLNICKDILFRYNVYTSQKRSIEEFLESINTIEDVIIPSIGIDKKIENDTAININEISMIPVSNMSSINQSIEIYFDEDIVNLEKYTLNLIKNTGIKSITLKCNTTKYDLVYEYIINLKNVYSFLDIKVLGIPLNEDTIKIYTITKMTNNEISIDIPNLSIKKKLEYNEILKTLKLAFCNNVNSICFNVSISTDRSNFHDLEKLIEFIDEVNNTFYNISSIKRKSGLNITINVKNYFKYDIDKIELKHRFLKENLKNAKLVFENPMLYILKNILKKEDRNLLNLLIKLSENGVRVYIDKNKINNKVILKTFDELNLDIKKYLSE